MDLAHEQDGHAINAELPLGPRGGGGCGGNSLGGGGSTGDADPEEASKETGASVMDSRVPRELAAYLAKPSAELMKRADEVRHDPSLLKPTCCNIAYELYSYSGRGAEIEETVSAWIRGEYSPE